MEGPLEKLDQGKQPIEKLELIFYHRGDPDAAFSIRVNGKADFGFLLGSGTLLKILSPEKISELFPYAFELTGKGGKNNSK